jgi:phosphoserine aminotransferase
MARVYSFNAGPAVLPLEVLEEAKTQLVEFGSMGMSLMEASHRGKEYEAVHQESRTTTPSSSSKAARASSSRWSP